MGATALRHYSRWEDAMVAQARLFDFTASPTGHRVLDYFETSLQAQHEPDARMPKGLLRAIQYTTLKDADPIFISGDVTEMIDVARETFQPEPVRVNDPFVQQGFALFPRPILLPDSDVYGDDAVMPIRAVAWLPVINPDDPTVGCFWISFYAHADDDLPYSTHMRGTDWSEDDAREMRRVAPLSLVHQFQWSFGTAPWTESYDHIRKYGPDTPATGPIGTPPGHEVMWPATGTLRSVHERGLAQVTLTQVLWRIGQQFVRAQQRAPRQIWKDAKRKGLNDPKDITVITLRRAKNGPEPEHESGRTLTVRHWVRGHWHTYYTKEGPRQMWITPYVRGAEHLPFKATKRVFNFVR